MRSDEVIKICVPGSTANLGPGFDSIGLAVNKYLTLEVVRSVDWAFYPQTEEVSSIPRGEENLIYKVASALAADYDCSLPPCSVKVSSDIPIARGLGSSAAAIVAGVELTNELCGLELSIEEKLRAASENEEHPDNVGASLFGGLVIGSHREDDTDLLHFTDLLIDIVVVIPDYEVMTKDARSVLPSNLTHHQAVEASSISNVLVAAILTKNWDLAGKMMEKDMFHQPYRSTLIPEVNEVRAVAIENGAFGVALSGAGPTVICFAEKGKGNHLCQKLKEKFDGYVVEELKIDTIGSSVEFLSDQSVECFK